MEDQNGWVGIGTSSPQMKLDIQDQQQGGVMQARFWNNTTNTNGTETRIDLPVFNGTSGLSIRSMGSSAGGYNVGTYDGWLHTGQEASFLHFSAGNASKSGVKHVTINRNGNVGIGTTDSKGYKLAVAGKMITEEVVVKLRPWPDYVFEEDYPLTPLQDLEIYLKKNKHLPGVPTAKEAEEEGVRLGEMNAKLLEKVEELTLYMIEQSKQTRALQDENELLAAQNDLLKEEIDKLKKNNQLSIEALRRDVMELRNEIEEVKRDMRND